MVRIPSEYQEVEWIQGSECRIDLEYAPYISPVAVMTFSIEDGQDRDIMGFQNNTQPSFIIDYSWSKTSGGKWFNRYFTTNARDFTPHPSLSQKNTWEFGRIVKCNGETVFTMKETEGDWSTNTKSFRIFGARKAHVGLKVYDFKLYDGESLIRNLVPCYKKSDDTIGMYDLVSHQFYTTNVGGTFTKGYDVNYDNINLTETRRQILINTPHLETTSGSVANFSTDMAANLKSCKAHFLPVQSGSGDPSPTNIRPISGWDGVEVYQTGINVWDEEWEAGALNSSTGETQISNVQIRSKNYIPVIAGATYYGFCRSLIGQSSSTLVVNYYDANKNFVGYGSGINGRTKTIPEGVSYIKFWTGTAYGGTYLNDISINYPSTDTQYHPYLGTTFPISWTQQGTVYGGYVDLVSGELVAEWERQFVDKNSQIGIFPWGGIMTDNVSGQEYASVLFRRGSLGRPVNNAWQYCYCDKLPLASGRVINTAYMYDGDIYGACISLPTSLIGTTIEEVKAYMENNTFDFVYKLRSPIRYQLTPTQIKALKGINNVYSDADNINVTYYRH